MRQRLCSSPARERAGFLYPLYIELHLSINSLPSSALKTFCISVAMVYSNCTEELYSVIHPTLLTPSPHSCTLELISID